MSWFYIALIVGALIGFALLWWFWSTLSWMQRQDEIRVQYMDRLRAERKEAKRALGRSGFGPNPFKDKSRKRVIEKEMDKVIREAINGTRV